METNNNLYQNNVMREVEYVNLRDKIANDLCGSKQARAYRDEFLAAFNAEHKTFVNLKNTANARQSDYDAHFVRLQRIVDKYKNIYSSEFNGGINAYSLTKDEAKRHIIIVQGKLNDLLNTIREYHRVLLNDGHSNYFYYNADALVRDIEKEMKETLHYEFCHIKDTDVQGYAAFVRKIYSHTHTFETRFKQIKANAPDWLFRK